MEMALYWAPRKTNPAGWLALIVGSSFYYAAPHLWPEMIAHTGLTLPSIALTTGGYLAFSRALPQEGAPESPKINPANNQGQK